MCLAQHMLYESDQSYWTINSDVTNILVNQSTTLEVGRTLCKFCINKNSFMCLLYLNKNVRNHSSATHDTWPISTVEVEAATEQCNTNTSSQPPSVSSSTRITIPRDAVEADITRWFREIVTVITLGACPKLNRIRYKKHMH